MVRGPLLHLARPTLAQCPDRIRLTMFASVCMVAWPVANVQRHPFCVQAGGVPEDVQEVPGAGQPQPGAEAVVVYSHF